MAFTPNNNPYIPGDPYSYDLKWIVEQIKNCSSILSTIDEKIKTAIINAMAASSPIIYENANSLIQSEQPENTIAFIQGYYTPGDNGANLYFVTTNYNDIIGAPFYLTFTTPNKWALPVIIFNYVTPEMFGAKGDGIEDDTSAIQTAINYGEYKTVYLTKEYKTTASLNLISGNFVNAGKIIYTGASYALILSPENNIDGMDLVLGRIIAASGNCLLLDSTSAWIQYLNIEFTEMSANAAGDCITAKVVGNNWINEVRINKGRFISGLNGARIDHSQKIGTSYTSHWSFVQVGFEGCTNGFNIPDYVTRTIFTDCRAEESITNVVLSNATLTFPSYTIVWDGSIANGLYWQNCPNYYILFNAGYINPRGTLICPYSILLYNDMLYGLKYYEGANVNGNDYPGAYVYDSGTLTQTFNFKTVYDYATDGYLLYNRPLIRVFTIPNNASATMTQIFLDDRMFLNNARKENNSFLLELTLSPGVTLQFYDKEGGTLLYSTTGGASTTYPRYIITFSNGMYLLQKAEVARKVV